MWPCHCTGSSTATAIVVDRGPAAQVQALLELDFRHARRTSAADLRQRHRALRCGVRQQFQI
jgi:hypothetical protein